MKNIKRLTLILVLTITSFLCISNVSASTLTKRDALLIENKLERYFGHYFFDEGEKFSSDATFGWVLIGGFSNSKYEVSREKLDGDVSNDRYRISYRVPAEVVENEIKSLYIVEDSFFDNMRTINSFWGYKEYNGKYYYEFTQDKNLSSTASKFNFKIVGYKKTDNNRYELYFMKLGDEYIPSSTDIEGVDYCVENGKTYSLASIVLKLVVYYDKSDLKFVSNQKLQEDKNLNELDLIMYDQMPSGEALKILNTTTKLDVSKDKNLTFRIDILYGSLDSVEVDGKIVDWNMYEEKSGSTIITFKEDFVKTLVNGKHTFKATFVDGSFIETEFTVVNSKIGGTVSNPKTGLFTGLGIVCLVGLVSIVTYIVLKKKNKLSNI